MDFLLNLTRDSSLIVIFTESFFFALTILGSFKLSKKFVNIELDKLGQKLQNKFDKILVLISGVILSVLINLICIMIINLTFEYLKFETKIMCEPCYRIMIVFSVLLISGYILSLPNHAHLRFLDTSNEESKSLCRTFFRIVILSFSIIIMSVLISYEIGDKRLSVYENLFSGLVVFYYFIEMLISRDLIAKVLRIKKFKEYSMAAKLSAFLNEKFAFLAFVGMISTVLFNYASSNNAQFIFFENMKSVCFLLSAMFLLQMTIALTINVLVIKLESLEINDNAENFTSSRKKNLIWICDVIVISIYFFIACFLLKHLGIDLREHVFHDKFITISLIVFVNILIYKSFKEFTNAVLEKERNDPNSDDYKTKLLTFMPTISVIFNTVLFGTSFLVILANFGIDVSPILATLAVFSASIGLAAKDVIQSFLQGLMLLIEKNLYIGEFVRINDVEGVIEKLSVRVIYLRNPDGRLHVIPYNLVNTITNYSKDYSCCNDELVVGSKEDVGKAIEILKKLIDKMKKEKEFGDKILGDLIIHGLKPFDMAGLKIFWNLKTTPDLSGRLLKYEIYRRLSAEFQKQGVSIPIANAIRLTDSKSAASDK